MIARMLVVVPAADEQDTIADCLTALLSARERFHRSRGHAVVSRIVVVLDACRDETAAVVGRFDGVDTVVSSARCVGAARALGVAHALRLDQQPPSHDDWIASTDADSRVPPDWLVRMAQHADRGDDLVVGTVRPDTLSRYTRRRWHAAHDLRDGHPHVHGANLGIRASTYERLGGWHHLVCHEDRDLVDRASADPTIRIRRSAELPVSTSSRRHGRAPNGFAAYLRGLDDGRSTIQDQFLDQITRPLTRLRAATPPNGEQP